MATVKILQSDMNEAILILPASLHTEQKELFMDKLGEDGFIIFPADDPLYPARETVGTFPENFMEDRNQPMLYPERVQF